MKRFEELTLETLYLVSSALPLLAFFLGDFAGAALAVALVALAAAAFLLGGMVDVNEDN